MFTWERFANQEVTMTKLWRILKEVSRRSLAFLVVYTNFGLTLLKKGPKALKAVFPYRSLWCRNSRYIEKQPSQASQPSQRLICRFVDAISTDGIESPPGGFVAQNRSLNTQPRKSP